jgi:hypothetical protein
MIAIVQQPDELTFARNPVLIVTRSTDSTGKLFAARGVFSKMEATAGQRIAAAQTITIAWTADDGTANSVVFTGNATPTAENHIPTTGSTDSAYWLAVALKIAAHHLISPFFKITSDSTGGTFNLNIQAKSTASTWVMACATSSGITLTNTNTVVADATPDNYKVFVDVFFEKTKDSGVFELAGGFEGRPDPLGYCFFDFSSVLDAACRESMPTLPIPEYDLATPQPAGNLRRYYLRYTESFGAPEAAEDWTNLPIASVINGGISQALFAQGGFLSGKNSSNAFLTWQPDGHTVLPNQPEWLPFFNFYPATISVYIERKWYKNTDLTLGGTANIFASPLYSVKPGETLLMPVNPAAMGIDAEATAYKYTIQLKLAAAYGPSAIGTAVSEIRTYYIDRLHYRTQRTLQYLSGLGCPETIVCKGAATKNLKLERQTSARVLQPGYSQFATDERQHAGSGQFEFIYRTGFVTASLANVLFDLLVGTDLWDVKSDGYLPLMFLDQNYEVSDSDKTLRSFTLKARPRLAMRNFSTQQITAPASDYWQEPDGSNWLDENLIPWGLPG